ncbi:MAG: DUF2987 domain-containing protein [Shewanella sp.]
MYKKLLFSGLYLLATNAAAETVSLEYKGFYDRLTEVNKGDYQLVEVAFSVPIQKNCLIQSGTISSEKTSTSLTYTDTQRLFIPLDDDLKKQRALVNLNFSGSAEGCAIAMQVRAKQTLAEYDKARLQQITTEMDTLLGAMQGFPMRYFRESIVGLNFEFSPEHAVYVYFNGHEQTVKGSYKLAANELENLTTLSFSTPPLVLSPWVK